MRTKKIVLFLTLTLFISGLSSCKSEIRLNSSLSFTKDNFPFINGSTPTVNISKIAFEKTTGLSASDAGTKINHEGTSPSYDVLQYSGQIMVENGLKYQSIQKVIKFITMSMLMQMEHSV